MLFDYYSAKFAIEYGTAVQTVGKITPEQLVELRSLMEATLEFVRDDVFTDAEGWIRTNNAFHEYLVELAGSVILNETYKGLRLPALELRSISHSTKAPSALLEDHAAIVEGYEAGDLDLVLRTLEAHARRPRESRTEGITTV